MNDTKIENALRDFVIEEGWQLARRFMKEVEREVGCSLDPRLLMTSNNVLVKWLNFVCMN